MFLKESRRDVVAMLYLMEITKCDIDEARQSFNIINPTNLSNHGYLATREILAKVEKLDEMINDNLVKYTIGRLNIVDKQIIRLAVYEMMNHETAHAIIIDEAVNISKELTETDDFMSSKFNNKLLDSISKRVKSEQ